MGTPFKPHSDSGGQFSMIAYCHDLIAVSEYDIMEKWVILSIFMHGCQHLVGEDRKNDPQWKRKSFHEFELNCHQRN